MNISIQSRSKAHNIIRKMLASLGDPYTRFLPPAEVTLSFTFIFSFFFFEMFDASRNWSNWNDPSKRLVLCSVKLSSFSGNFFNLFMVCIAFLFLFWKFSKMARYDMTGIGINLREVPDDNGSIKIKVLGLLLDGPAHSAGVRQVTEVTTTDLIFKICSLLCFWEKHLTPMILPSLINDHATCKIYFFCSLSQH